MARTLGQIKFIDLEHSEWDRKLSNPKLGKYVFTVKRYLDYRDKGRRPHWAFSWGHIDTRTGGGGWLDWQVEFGYTPVTLNDPYWPEGVVPDAEGKYVWKDAILMKRPLIEELRERKANQDRANMMVKSKVQQFQRDAKRDGVEIDEQTLQALMGEPPRTS